MASPGGDLMTVRGKVPQLDKETMKETTCWDVLEELKQSRTKKLPKFVTQVYCYLKKQILAKDVNFNIISFIFIPWA